MREISIRLLLQDPFHMENRHLLDVSCDKFGVLQYRLSGELSGSGLSISNLQTKVRLPDIINGLSLDDLVVDIISSISTGTEKVRTVVFKKELFKNSGSDNREIVKRGFVFWFSLVANSKDGFNLTVENITEIRDLIETIYTDLGNN